MYRQEHPKPQFCRDTWENLNGQWQFAIDFGHSGQEREWFLTSNTSVFDKTIEVPFCPESALSGVTCKDFMNSVWYARTVQITQKQLIGRVFLHFGACDWFTTVWVNEHKAGKHCGGYVSFYLDITDYVHEGENRIVINAEDDTRSPAIPTGKQCAEYYSKGCAYTRTTGIWQTVWLEFVPATHINTVTYNTCVENNTVTIDTNLIGADQLDILVSYQEREMAKASVVTTGGDVALTLPLAEAHLWDIGKGELYDVTLTYGSDVVHSYFGLRKIEYRDKKFFLNGKSVFQRLVLDQGFYPDGVYTAPSDAELLGDIKRSVAMGFNGARLHQKVFEERFLYHCDKEGYIVWGEYPNWGLDHTNPALVYGILYEWVEEVKRDRNHPAIVGWCPFNETWNEHGREQCNDVLESIFRVTKAIDPYRPCIDTSGNYHVGQITDIYDVHDYEQDPQKFAVTFATLKTGGSFKDRYEPRQKYLGDKPFFVSEYGGIRWTDKEGWGYGQAPKDREEFLSRLKGLTDVLLQNPNIFAYCYTQLTDVEQEQNGLYTYERQPKFDPLVIHAILSAPAAVEQ